MDAYQRIFPASRSKDTALRISIKGGFPDVVRVLLSKGADSFLQDEYGKSPLYEALQETFLTPLSDSGAILQMLLDSGLDINSKMLKGHTALYHGCIFSSQDVVRSLMDQGADLKAPTGCSNCAYELGRAIFLQYRYDSIVHMQFENTRSGEAGTGGRALHVAAYNARADIVDVFIERGADVNAFGGCHGTALIAECSGSWDATERLRMVETLVENGAEIHVPETAGGNALQAASYNGHADIVKFLSCKGADVNSWGGEYGTALIAACCSVRKEGEVVETVKVLVNKAADINYLGERYGSALYQAALNGNHNVLKLLNEAKADVNIWNNPAEAPLVATCAGRGIHIKIAKLFLDNGAYVNTSESVAVRMASKFGSKEMVTFVVKNGASLKATESGSNALHCAALYARADIADTLIAFGLDVNSHDFKWRTPLHLACSAKSDTVIATDTDEPEMLFNSADRSAEEIVYFVSAKVHEIVSGAHLAALRKERAEKRLVMFRLLVEKKADVNAWRARGVSVLQDALERDDRDLVDFLIANGPSLDQERGKSDVEEDGKSNVGTDDNL